MSILMILRIISQPNTISTTIPRTHRSPDTLIKNGSPMNKGTGMAAVRQLPVYGGRTLFAVGDYWNDVELLQAADVPCCPENAIDEVKALCAHILPSHNDSALAALIRDVLPTL